MNKRLDNAVEVARSSLGDAAQEELAELVERFLDRQEVDPEEFLTPGELAELDRRLAADKPPADMESVREIFRRRGLDPRF